MNPFFPIDNSSRQIVPDQRAICESCNENLPLSSMNILNCPCHHKFCYNCLKISVENHLSNGIIPHCPSCDPYYDFSMEEYATIMSGGDLNDSSYEMYSEKYDDYITSHYMNDFTIHCYDSNCDGYLQVDRSVRSVPMPLECPKCHKKVCSFGNHEGHYNTTCVEYQRLKFEYDQWKYDGKEKRYQQRCLFDKEFDQWSVDKTEFEAEKRRIEENYRTEYQTEEQLSFSARLCPHCQRIIQKVDGCDLMVCGRNYHGGNQQNGCGKPFEWSKAAPYVPVLPSMSEIKFTKVLPNMNNMVYHNKGYYCGICHSNEIKGIRFVCLNCPAFFLCEKCEHNRIKEHYGGKHVFKLCLVDFE